MHTCCPVKVLHFAHPETGAFLNVYIFSSLFFRTEQQYTGNASYYGSYSSSSRSSDEESSGLKAGDCGGGCNTPCAPKCVAEKGSRVSEMRCSGREERISLFTFTTMFL